MKRIDDHMCPVCGQFVHTSGREAGKDYEFIDPKKSHRRILIHTECYDSICTSNLSKESTNGNIQNWGSA